MSDQSTAAVPIEQASQEASPLIAEAIETSGNANEALTEQVSEAIEQGATPQEVKKMIKEFKLKVNGKEVIKKIDLLDEKAILKELQIAEANKSGMSRARELEKLLEKEIRRLKETPWDVLQEMGHDPYALSEQKLGEWVEQQKKSPEQLEFEKMQKELNEARSKAKDHEDELEKIKYESLKNQATKEIENEIESALAGTPSLPKSGKTIGRIVDALQWAYDNGFPEASVKDVIPMVEQDILRETQEFFENMDESLFEKYLGQKNVERMRKKRIAQMKQAPSAEFPTVTKLKTDGNKAKEKISYREFFKNLK